MEISAAQCMRPMRLGKDFTFYLFYTHSHKLMPATHAQEICTKKLVEVILYQKLPRVSVNLVQVCFWYATEHSSIPAQKLWGTWHEPCNVIGQRVVLVQETVMNSRQIFRASFWFPESVSRTLITSTGLDWIEQCFMPPPTQYRLYEGTVFIGQKTQPTVSKYWRKIYKGKQPREQRKHKIHICIHTK